MQQHDMHRARCTPSNTCVAPAARHTSATGACTGVEDDGYPRGLEPGELAASITVLQRMAESLDATAALVEYVAGGFGRSAALLHIKANAAEGRAARDTRVAGAPGCSSACTLPPALRLALLAAHALLRAPPPAAAAAPHPRAHAHAPAVAGGSGGGKSSLVAALTHGSDGRPLLDNGRGGARLSVLRHKHEIESGRTSSISQALLGFDAHGRVLNYAGVSPPTPAELVAGAARAVTLIDVGGAPRALKTALYGLTCLLPGARARRAGTAVVSDGGRAAVRQLEQCAGLPACS